MSESNTELDRRDFLRGSMVAMVAGAIAIPENVPGETEADGLFLAAKTQKRAELFLDGFVEGWLPLQTAAEEANWAASTDVSEAHTAAQVARNLELNRYVGAPRVIDTVRRLLEAQGRTRRPDGPPAREDPPPRRRSARDHPRGRQGPRRGRGQAGGRPRTGSPSRIRREGKDAPASANDIDRILVESRNLDERRAAWEASKTIGRPLRDGLLRLRDLRNKVARAMGFDDFFALQVADYGMTVPEMIALCDRLIAEMKPLYQQLHAWARHALAKRYRAEVPRDGKIPAHWLPNRWGQNWPGLVEGIDMDAPFKGKPKEFITEQAERFYVSLGFPRLPKSFWEKSDLYPADPKSGRKKNSHASAWHIDLNDDVRSLMSIEPNSRWFTTAHHELGHIYYYISYSTPGVPYLLRSRGEPRVPRGDRRPDRPGGRPAALSQAGRALDGTEAEKADAVTFLLDTALDGSSVVFLPWSAGVMTHFEHDFYAGKISDDALNAAWWALVGQYQGIAPPGERA